MHNRRPLVWATATLLFLMSSSMPAEATRRNFPTSQGWANPSAASIYDDWDFNLCTTDYFYWGNPPLGRTHLGADSQGSGAWTTVRAMADGVIVSSETGWPGQSIGIVHYTSTGEAFLGIYGHLANAPTSGTVSRSQAIGTTEAAASHLHLGVRPISASQAADYIANGGPDIRGQGDTSCPSSTYGYVDPIPWLAARSPGTLVPVDPSVSVSPSLGESDPLTTFRFTGGGFTPNGAIYQTFYNPNGSHYAGAYTRNRTATSSGGFGSNVIWFWEAGDPFGRYRAVFEDVTSGETETVYFTIAEEPTPPGAPGCTVDDEGGVSVSWSTAASNGSTVTRYDVRSQVVGGATAGWTSTGTNRQRLFTNLSLGTAHRFSVRAANGAGDGNASAWSASCTPRAVPAIAADLQATVVGPDILVSWTPPDPRGAAIAEYDLVWEEVPGGGSGSISTPSHSWTFQPPNPSGAYRFQVAARNAAGWGAPSSWTTPLTADPGPLLAVSAPSLREPTSGSTSVLFVVSLSEISTEPIDVRWTTRDGEAQAPADYEAQRGTLRFEPGQTLAHVEIAVHADDRDEGRERFGLQLTKAIGATIESHGYATIVDATAAPHLVPGTGEALEGDQDSTILRIPVGLSAPSERKVLATWTPMSLHADVGVDLADVGGTLEFAPGQTEAFIEVEVLGDYEVETDEWFEVELSAPQHAELLPGLSTASGLILDNGDTGITVPEAPATPNANSGLDRRVSITWSPPAFDGGVAIDRYELQRVGTSDIRTDTASPFDWTGLSNGTAYRFQVRACNLVGCGPWSADSNSATPYTVPGQPSTPSVSSQNNALAVSWGVAASNGSSISRYDLQYGGTVVNTGTARSRTVSFSNGSARTFRARACNAAGCGAYSAWSASLRPKTISLARGGSAPWGYWYDTTVTGPAGWSTTLHCNDGADASFWTQAITIPSSGSYRDSTLCYSGDLNPHWVHTGSLESNRLSW